MEEQEIDIRAILGVLRRRIWLILATVVLVMGVVGLVTFSLKPAYTASALVMVDPARKDLLEPDPMTGSSASDNARVESEVELVRSDTTLLRVIDEIGLLSHPEFGPSLGLRDTIMAWLRIEPGDPPSGEAALQAVLSKLRNAVSVSRRGVTYLISVSARAGDPQTATRIANAVADIYIKEQLEAKIASTLASRDIIQGRIADSSAAVVASEEAFDGFISANIDTITAETGRMDIVALRDQLAAANAERSRLSALVETADTSLARRDWNTLAASLQSDRVAGLVARRAELAAAADASVGSPQEIDLRAQLAVLDQELDQQASADLGSLRQEVAETQTRATDLRARLRTNVLSSDLPADVLTNIYELQQNAEIARSQYQTLLSRLRDLEARAYLQVADSRIVSEAFPPSRPSFPNTGLILMLSGLAAVGLGVMLAFLYDNFIGGFTTEEQLEAVLRVPNVGAVPRQKALRDAAGVEQSLSAIMIEQPLSMFAESVRRVRAGIDQAMRRRRGQANPAIKPDQREPGTVVMVTSTNPNEGKTTLALSLARAYALSGRSTLLIDCDLRKPSLHRQLGIEPSVGLLEYLRNAGGGPMLADIVAPDPASGAQIAVGARRSDFPTDQLITGEAFSRLIHAACTSFDVVVLDTPPVGPVVDGIYLAPFADVIAFVVQWATTSQREARSAIDALAGAKRPDAEIVSVLNQQTTSRTTYRSKYAGYYAET